MTLFENEIVNFPTAHPEILQRISSADPIRYGQSRNFIDGAVTYLSPYISRGVISTKQVLNHVLTQGYPLGRIEKFIQELAWRDYWQQVWLAKGRAIDSDLKKAQERVSNHGIPNAMLSASTEIQAIDQALVAFYQTGYLHNHVRMYIAAICCNMGQSHWYQPAKWMYYHLLDADWASNALSWQWVAGTNSNKKYVANQTNINKYCHSQQKGTFLDVDYGDFPNMEIPKQLEATTQRKWMTPFPERRSLTLNTNWPSYIYNFYNLDPLWDAEIEANRILLLEPSIFEQYPISEKSMAFMLELGKNIEGLQIYIGEFDALVAEYGLEKIHFKEHPLNTNYKGTEVSRDWMFDVTGYYSSFFGFWKKCKKQLPK